MAWTAPKTWMGATAAGGSATSDDLNLYLRDNTAYLYDQSIAVLQNGSGTTIPNNAATTLSFSSGGGGLLTATADMTVTSVSSFTPTVPGLYELWADLVWAGNGTGIREVGITEVAVQNIALADDVQLASGQRNTHSVSGTYWWQAGQLQPTFQVQVFQTSGAGLLIFGTLTTSLNLGTGVPCQFGIRLIGSGV